MKHPQERIGSLYHATRRENPPHDLDRAILTAARTAARRRRLRWVVPASSAALVLLGLSLSYRFLEDLAVLDQPKTLAPSLPDDGPASERSGGRMPRTPPEPPLRPAPAPKTSEMVRGPAKAPAPRLVPGLTSETKTQRATPTTPEPRRRTTVAEPPVLGGIAAEEESPARSADQWLAQVRAYKQAGDIEAARDLLREFLLRFPDAETPEDLRDLLATP